MKKMIMIPVVTLTCLLMLSFGLAGAFTVEGVDIHGFIGQGYLKSDDNNYLADTEDGTAEFTEMGINFSKEFDKLRIGFQLFSRDLGEYGNNEIELDWAVGDYRINEMIGIRAGKVKMPLGFYNQERDLDMLRTSVLLPASVYDEAQRGLVSTFQGAGVYGLLDGRVAGEFEYELFYGGTSVDNDSLYMHGIASSAPERPGGVGVASQETSVDYIAGGALRWNTPLEGLRIGGSYNRSESVATVTFEDGEEVEMEIPKEATWVASVEYTWDNLTLTAEYAESEDVMGGGAGGEVNMTGEDDMGEADGDMSMPGDGGMGGAPDGDKSIISQGWYCQATWRFNDWCVAGIYYSEFYPDKDDKDGLGEQEDPDYYAWQKEIVPFLRFDVGYNFIVKAEVHFVDGAAQVYEFNNEDGIDKDWNLYVLKMSYNF